MPQSSQDRAATLFRHFELFLDGVEGRGRELDAEECEALAEMLVHLSRRNYQRCEGVMRRLETLLAVRVPMRGRRRSADDVATVAEYRALLKLVRDRK